MYGDPAFTFLQANEGTIHECAYRIRQGEITLRKDLLKHLGVQPGEKIAVERLPDDRIEVKAARPTGKISNAFGFLKRKNGRSLSIKEMNKIAARGLGRQAMKVAADTDVLVRAVTDDYEPRIRAAKPH